MSNLQSERTCSECGTTFTLEDHGVAGATAVAQQLDEGTISEDALPNIAQRCPNCHGTGKVDPQTATAAMFSLDLAMKQAKGRQVPSQTKGAIAGLAFFGANGLLASLFLGMAYGATPITTLVGIVSAGMLVAAIVVGAVTAAGAFGGSKKSGRKSRS